MLQNNILLILLVSVFHLKRSRINEQWKRLYQKFPLSWCIMQQLKNIQKATLLSRLCRSPLSHCEQHLSDSFILIYSIVYNRGPNINQCKAKMMSERFKRMCEQNKHILLYFQLIFPHSCENTGCDGNGRELMAVLSHILVVELLSRGSYNISLRPNKLHPPMGDGVRTVPVKPRSPHSLSWWNICFCPSETHAEGKCMLRSAEAKTNLLQYEAGSPLQLPIGLAGDQSPGWTPRLLTTSWNTQGGNIFSTN